jgi:hypothetical protein
MPQEKQEQPSPREEEREEKYRRHSKARGIKKEGMKGEVEG